MRRLARLSPLVNPRLRRRLWRSERTGRVILCRPVLTAASFPVGYALRLMPVGETGTIVCLAPCAVILLAIPLFGERVPLAGWIGAVLGVSAVLVIPRPGGGLDAVGVIRALANAACATADHAVTRLPARTEMLSAALSWVTRLGAVFFSTWRCTPMSRPARRAPVR